MSKKQSPPRRQPAAGNVVFLDQWYRKYPASRAQAQCIECQAPFERLPSETWKIRCYQCWLYLALHRLHKREQRIFDKLRGRK
jgi:hypothetical protein